MASSPLINRVDLSLSRARLVFFVSACRVARVFLLTAPPGELERLNAVVTGCVLKALFEDLWAYIVNIREYISEPRLYHISQQMLIATIS